jgi:hypothetical protein
MDELLTEENFFVYCAKQYQIHRYHTDEEFLEDINRIKYIKKLVTRYVENGDLKERLILNHIIVLNNVFGAKVLNRILYLKLNQQFLYIKPFLYFLNILQDTIYNIGPNKEINLLFLNMDTKILEKLGKI